MRNNRFAKFMGLFLSVALCLTLAACGNSLSTEDAAAPESVPEETAVSPADTEDVFAETMEEDATSDAVQTAGSAVKRAALGHLTEDAAAPEVFFTSDISSAGLIKAYDALNWTPTGKTAVKLSTGEPPNSNYLRPELIADLVKSVDGAIVECNTAYGGSRASAAMHKQVAQDHGFTAIADFDLMDEDGETEIPVTGGVRIDKAIVGSHIDNYDSVLVLSHFKGHAMAGFGGAIKNVAIGMSSASGKVLAHTAGERTTGSIFYSDHSPDERKKRTEKPPNLRRFVR